MPRTQEEDLMNELSGAEVVGVSDPVIHDVG
jgi:hypothetical protein